MRNKLTILSVFIVIFAVLLCGCNEEAVETSFSGEIERPETVDINDVHLRDKNLLYEQYDPTEVVTMYLTVSTGNAAENTNHTWEEINTYSVYDYDRMGVDRYNVEGLLQIGDENGLIMGELGYGMASPNCTIQIRGQSSSRNPQKNYKIKIKENKGSWRGQTTIALNKHMSDGLRFKNKMAYDMLSEIDELMGLRTTFVHLYVKDTTAGGSGQFEDYGLYTQVEQLNKTALKAHGLDKNGHLYKINVCEFYRYEDAIRLKDDPTFDLKAFEEILEIKGDDDHSKLIKMLDDVNDYSIPIDTILDKHFDIENLSYWMAFQILIGNVDTQSRNFYIYSPLNSNKWYIYSWDHDGSFNRQQFIFTGRQDYQNWERGISNYWGNVLFQRCLKSEKYRKALDSAIEDLRQLFTPEFINGKIQMYSSVVKPYVFSMPDIMHSPLTSEQYDIVAASFNDEIEENYRLYKESYKKPQPFYIGVPTKDKNTGKISVMWDNSYDFNAETITYTFELATDYSFTNPIHKQENIIVPETSFDALPPGQYFMRVTSKNQSGYSQYAFDSYVLSTGKIYGTKCFYVNAAGEIVEDEYVET